MPITYSEELGQYIEVNPDGVPVTWNSLVNPTAPHNNPFVETKSKAKKAQMAPDVFIRKKTMKKPGLNIQTLMRTRQTTGDIGIEIEVEGNKFPKAAGGGYSTGVSADLIPDVWCYHHDGSLRGHDNAEYVLRKPIKFEEVKGAIEALWNMFAKFGSKLDESNRTSVHIHLNAQKWHLNRVCAFSALYFSLEELLTEWCGDHRVGNLFCLRAKDAPGIISKLKDFIVQNGEFPLSEGLHYGGLNVHALCKYGSLEVRALRGCTNPQTILDWVDILERLYKLSGTYKDPRAICDNFSGEGPMAYLSTVLGPKAQVVKDGVKWDNQRIMESLYEGIRLAQDLCYCREWSEYEPIEVTPDPFDRDPKKVVAGLEALNWQQIGSPLTMTTQQTGLPEYANTFAGPQQSEPVLVLNGTEQIPPPQDTWFGEAPESFEEEYFDDEEV